MFSVIFEVLSSKENWDDYLDNAEMLRPEREQVEGFVDNIRYKSLTREGWILSLSNWRDEKSLVRAPACAITRFSRRAATKSSQTTTCASARSLLTIKCRRGTPSRSSGSTRPKSGRERWSR
jgi:hypothetical protein